MKINLTGMPVPSATDVRTVSVLSVAECWSPLSAGRVRADRDLRVLAPGRGVAGLGVLGGSAAVSSAGFPADVTHQPQHVDLDPFRPRPPGGCH